MEGRKDRTESLKLCPSTDPGCFVFTNIVLEVHGAEVFAKTK